MDIKKYITSNKFYNLNMAKNTIQMDKSKFLIISGVAYSSVMELTSYQIWSNCFSNNGHEHSACIKRHRVGKVTDVR